MTEKKFAEGFYFNKKRDQAPEFVLGSVSLIPDKFIAWLGAQEKDDKGYVRLSILQSREGKIYAEVDTWRPTAKEVVEPAIQVEDKLPSQKLDTAYAKATKDAPKPDDIPFN